MDPNKNPQVTPPVAEPQATSPQVIQPQTVQPQAMQQQQPVTPIIAPTQPAYVAPPAQQFTDPAPVYSQQSQYGGAPEPSSSSKKRLIIGAVCAVAAVVVLAGAGFAIKQFSSVSKEDYRAADSVLNDATDAYNKMSTVYLSTSSTPTEIANDSQKLTESRKEFKEKFADLGKEKAIKSDKELKVIYESVSKKMPAFDAATDATLEAYTKILPAVTSTRDAKTSSGDVVGTITNLKKQFDSVGELKDDNNKAFVAKMSSLLDKYASLAVKVQAGREDFKKYDGQIVSDFYDTATELDDAARDWRSNLTKLTEAGELQNDLNKLQTAVLSKTLESK